MMCFARKIVRCLLLIAMLGSIGSVPVDVHAELNDDNTIYLDQSLDPARAEQNFLTPSSTHHPFYIKKPCDGIAGIHTLQKIVALTFDDGPSRQYTPQILEILKNYQVKATFFVVGRNVLRYPTVLDATVREGHTIGVHSYSHPRFNKLSKGFIRQELVLTSGLVSQLSGIYPLLFRPPYGSCSALSTAVTQEMGYKTIMWADDANDFDFKNITTEQIVSGIMLHASPGRIILLHDGGGNRSKTVAALPLILDALKKKGYHVISLQDLLEISAYR